MNSFISELNRLNFENILWVIFIVLSIRNIIGDNYEKEYGSATVKINGIKPIKPTNPDDPDNPDEPIDSHIQFVTPYVYAGSSNPYPTPVYVVDESNGAG